MSIMLNSKNNLSTESNIDAFSLMKKATTFEDFLISFIHEDVDTLCKSLEAILIEYENIASLIDYFSKSIESDVLKLYYYLQKLIISKALNLDVINSISNEYDLLYDEYSFEIKKSKESLLNEILQIKAYYLDDYKDKLRYMHTNKKIKMELIKKSLHLQKTFNTHFDLLKNYINWNDAEESFLILKETISLSVSNLEEKSTNDTIEFNLTEDIDFDDNILNDDIKKHYKKTLRYKDLIRLAKKEGYSYIRQHGSHAIFKSLSNNLLVIPDKPGVAPRGLQCKILKDIFYRN